MFIFPENNNIHEVKIIAHRGSCNYMPENTLESFAIGIQSGADYVEMDVQLTKDQQVIVFHDPYLSRVTNIEKFPEFLSKKCIRRYGEHEEEKEDYYVIDFTLEELKKLKVYQKVNVLRTSIFDGKFDIPTLDEVLHFIVEENKRIKKLNQSFTPTGIFLEIKDRDFYMNECNGIEIGEYIYEVLKRNNLSNKDETEGLCPITIISFDQKTLQLLSTKTDLMLNQLLWKEFYPFEEIAKYAQAIGPSLSKIYKEKNILLKSDLAANARAAGLKIYPWTLRDDDLKLKANSEEIHKSIFLEGLIDGITTDFPGKAKAILDLLKNEIGKLNKEST